MEGAASRSAARNACKEDGLSFQKRGRGEGGSGREERERGRGEGGDGREGERSGGALYNQCVAAVRGVQSCGCREWHNCGVVDKVVSGGSKEGGSDGDAFGRKHSLLPHSMTSTRSMIYNLLVVALLAGTKTGMRFPPSDFAHAASHTACPRVLARLLTCAQKL